jgi:hypothetical protein
VNLAAARESGERQKVSAKFRNDLAERMSPSQLAEAQKRGVSIGRRSGCAPPPRRGE